MSTNSHVNPREVVSGVLWFWVEFALVLTIGLLVMGAFFILESPTVRVVLGVMVVGVATHLWSLGRRRAELQRDPALRAQRERRGF